MAEHPHHQRHHHQHHESQQQHPTESIKSMLPTQGPSTSQVLAVVTLLPIGGILLTLAGLTLAGTVLGLAVATPLFVIFSPVLVPAALTIGLAVTGFLTSGAFGLSGLSSMSWIFNYLREIVQPDHAKQEAMGQLGQKTQEMGQGFENKAHEGRARPRIL